MLTWQEHPEWRGRKNYQPTEPLEESRQHYATVRIQEFQRAWARVQMVPPFYEVLSAFRHYGELYDQGYRLRDGWEAAA